MTFSLKPKYKQERGPKAISFAEYKKDREKQLKSLLSNNPNESAIQKFLEKNPAFVPGAWTPGNPSGHYPLHCALITQPLLPGLHSQYPDFMWISTHSGTWYPTLIEIESPNKNIFTKYGTPTAHFSQARNQLADWKTWFNEPSNVALFINSYGIPQSWLYFRTMELHMILIYGRREEVKNNPRLSKKRASLLSGTNEELISFDRLSADEELRYAITVKASGNACYKVVELPPIFTLNPHIEDRLVFINGYAAAINKNDEIPEERKAFLKKRISYWRKWASLSDTGVIGPCYGE